VEFFSSEQSLFSLFMLSFLASTIVPLGSEWLLGVLVVNSDYSSLSLILVATAGNYLGACTTYLLGRWGSDLLIYKLLRTTPEEATKAKRRYHRWGSWSLLFSWLPIIGDPLCLAAGIFKTKFLLFSLPVLAGKLARYGFVVWAVGSTLSG
jgi:membrane protein YqaA with SNARE-associated domain